MPVFANRVQQRKINVKVTLLDFEKVKNVKKKR